jgi:cystathionine gamma-synthase
MPTMTDTTEHQAPDYRRATVAVVAGRPAREADAPLNPPLVPSSTYVAGGVVGYGRSGNPTWTAFETAVGRLDDGHAVAFASGIAAVTAVLGVLPAGPVVAPRCCYHGTRVALERRGVEVRWVDPADTAAVLAALPGAAALWVESIGNPLLEVPDVPALADAARAAGVRTVVDATLATPILQRPLTLGADMVVHSATKAIGGHADLLLGVAITGDPSMADALRTTRTTDGAVPGQLETWLALRGLRTLPLRVQASVATATALAERLAAHPGVLEVRYPGLADTADPARVARVLDGPGSMLAVRVRGGAEAADRVVARTRLWVPATSLGGVESLLERRRRWPDEHPDVPQDLLRLSVGVEDAEDLWADLVAALG